MIILRVRLSDGGHKDVEVAEDGDPLHLLVAEALEIPEDNLELVVGTLTKTQVRAGDKRTPRALGLGNREAISAKLLASSVANQNGASASSSSLAAAPKRRKPRASKKEKSIEEQFGDSREGVAKRLVEAFQGGPKDNVSVFMRKATRGFMNDAHARRDASDRYAAALSGDFEIVRPKRNITGSAQAAVATVEHLTVRYGTEHGSNKVRKQDSVKLLARPVLAVTIKYVLSVQDEACKSIAQEKMRPRELALHSPNVFWSLAEVFRSDLAAHTKTMEEALQELCPSVDWTFLQSRKRDKSEKALQAEATKQKLEEDKVKRKAAVEERKRKREAEKEARENMGPDDRRQKRAKQAADLAALKGIFEDDDALVRSVKSKLKITTVLELAGQKPANLAQAARRLRPDTTLEQAEIWLDSAKFAASDALFLEILGGDMNLADKLTKGCGLRTPHDLERIRIPGRTEAAMEETGKSKEEVLAWQEQAAKILEEHPVLKGIRSRG